MATLKLRPDPFVKWKYKCTTAKEERETKKRARKFLSFYLQGYAKGLRLGNLFYPKVSFQITNEKFSRVGGSNIFNFSATVLRKSSAGAIFPSPDSTINPTRPTPPNP